MRLLLFITFFIYSTCLGATKMQLTTQEQEWLNNQSGITVGIQTKWIPLSYVQNGQPKGLGVDYIHLLNKRLDGKLKIIPDNFKSSLEKLKKKQIDAMIDITPTKERQKYYLFTTPYITIPHAILTAKNNQKKYKSEKELNGVTLSVEKGFRTPLSVRQSAPNAKFIEYEDSFEAIEALSIGKVDAYVGNRAVANYVLQERFITNLEFTKNVKRKGSVLAIGVNKENKVLKSILQKALDSITDYEKSQIYQKYIEAKGHSFNFTIEEKKWLQNNHTIKLAFMKYWPSDSNGNNIHTDIVQLLNKYSGLNFVFAKFDNWSEGFKEASKGDLIHGIMSLSWSKEREKNNFYYTKPYDFAPSYLITREENKNINSLKDLKGKTVYIKAKTINNKILNETSQDINIIEKKNDIEMYKSLIASGEADAILSYTLDPKLLKKYNLKLVKSIYSKYSDISIGVSHYHKPLQSIINKIYKIIPDNELTEIRNKKYVEDQSSDLTHQLTQKEKIWIEKNNGRITMCIDPEWMPIEKIDENGKHIGITKDIFELFKQRLGIEFVLVPTKSWTQSLEYAKQKKCDILSFLKSTEDRSKFLNFTSALYKTPDIIVAKKNTPFLTGLESLKGKKVGIIKGYAIEELIKKEHPEIEIVYIKNLLDGFEQISKGKLFAVIDTLLISAHNINAHGYQDLKIAGRLDVENKYRVGVRKDSPELLSIMEKAVQSLNDTDIGKINSKWISVAFEHRFDYTLLWKILGGVLLIIGAFIYWNRKLAHEISLRIKAQQEANAANEAKSLFLAKMSHEIRTPMNAILGMLYLTQKSNLNPIQDNYVDKAKKAADSLLHVINDILDFSKIEAGKLDIELVEFDFNEMMANIASIMSFKAEEKGVELLIKYDPSIPQFLISDPVRLEQILLNLVSNAVKFTTKGEVVISPKIKKKDGENLVLEFCIKDSGIGIASKDQSKLFKDFSQVDESTTRKFGGTGLGLAISSKLSQMLGGKIWLEKSSENKGSTFCFTIQCQKAKMEQKKPHVFPPSLQELKTLIVDDNHIACNILSNILNDFKIHSEIVHSGEEALKVVLEEQKSYDIIFLDYKLGGINGVETYQRIKENLQGAMPKVIMISAYAQDDVITNFKAIGIEWFLTKPVQPSLLFDTILLTLDQDKKASSLMRKENHQGNVSLESIQGAHILLVEDNALNREFAIILLEGNGLNVDVANNGLEAIDKVKLKKYDLVLMDIQMPMMNGLEATQEIRKLQDPYFKKLPIVALSAHAMAGDVEKSLDAGMNDHVIKPINPDKLFEVLLTFIEAKTNKKSNENRISQNSTLFLHLKSDFIDYEEGVHRAGNNELGYLKVLRSFAKKYQGFVNEVQLLLEEKDFIEAEKKTHEIKGISGNIGAVKLYHTIQEIDELLKQEIMPKNEQLQLCKVFLDDTIKDINNIPFEELTVAHKTFNKEKVLELLDSVENNLEVNIVASEDALEELNAYLHQEKYEKFITTVTEQLESFETDLARQTIEKFKDELKEEK